MDRFLKNSHGFCAIPNTAHRDPLVLSSQTRLERLRYACEQNILNWRDAEQTSRPYFLLHVRSAQSRISQAKFRNAQLANEISARSWVDNWEPRSN